MSIISGCFLFCFLFFFFPAEDGIRDAQESRGLGDVYKRQVHNNLGILLARQHRLREAIPHFRAALAIDPHDASIRNNLDVALRKESETQTGRDQ